MLVYFREVEELQAKLTSVSEQNRVLTEAKKEVNNKKFRYILSRTLNFTFVAYITRLTLMRILTKIDS